MIENTFVVVGTILQIDRVEAGLKVVIGGRGPVKLNAAFEVHDADLVTIMLDTAKGFRTGDTVSAGGSLRFDEATGRTVAVADRTRVALVARGPAKSQALAPVKRAASAEPSPNASGSSSSLPAAAPPISSGMFGGSPAPGSPSVSPPGPGLPEGFPPPMPQFPDIPF